MLFVPTAYSHIKLVLLVSLLLGVLALGVRTRLKLDLHRSVVVLTAAYVCIGIFFVVVGVLQEAPGALRVATVYVLWPIVYVLLLAGVARVDLISKLPTLFASATLAISVYALTYVLAQAGLLPRSVFVHLDQGESISFAGFLQFNLYSLASLLFLIPYTLAGFAVGLWEDSRLVRVLAWSALLLGTLVAFLSLRRALILVVALSPILIVALLVLLPPSMARNARRRLVRAAAATAVFLLCASLYGTVMHNWSVIAWVRAVTSGYDVTAAAEGFAAVPLEDASAQQFKVPRDTTLPPLSPTGDNISGTLGAGARGAQFRALLDGWLAHPILGAGLGASAAVIRSREQPWAYELSYLALLFQTGLVGFGLYSCGILWVFWRGMQAIRSGSPLARQALPVLVGSACFLAANATNPYLNKFDYLWVVFLPLGIVNIWLLRTRSSPELPGKVSAA